MGRILRPLFGWSLVLAACITATTCFGITERTTDTIVLKSGEIISNKSFLTVGRDYTRHNRLSFRQSAFSSRESLAEVIEEDAAPISLQREEIQIAKSGKRLALRIGSHVFRRSLDGKRPYWSHMTTTPISRQPAALFLRSFLDSKDSQVPNPFEFGVGAWPHIPTPEVPYEFDHFDLREDVLVTRRASPDPRFPEFLVYKAFGTGARWEFDIERTRNANHLEPPSNTDIVMDVSVVLFPRQAERDDTFTTPRHTFLAIPGAQEFHSQTIPLSSSKWTVADYSFTSLTGISEKRRFEALLGFLDPLPYYASVLVRHSSLEEWRFVALGDWVCYESSGHLDGTSIRKFFRIRRTQDG